MRKNTLPNGESELPRAINRSFVSFFSGALGLDIGLEHAGWHCVAANDVDTASCETIRSNRPQLKLYDRDIRQLTPEELLRDLKVEREELFAVVGGPPCQAFSTAGRRLGLNDERGNVFLHFIELIKGLRPKYIVFENVRGLLSAPLVHKPHNQRKKGSSLSKEESPGGALLHIVRVLEDAGYPVSFTLYNVANFGVPQIRERLIFFASREGKEVPFISPTHDEFGANGLQRWKTLRDAIGGLQRKPLHAATFPAKRLKYYEMLTAGQNWRNLPSEVQPEAMGASWHAGGGKTGFYRRLAWDKPAPTLVTRPNMPATDLCHPEQLRPLSVEEYAALQTFPSSYKFSGRLDDQYRQIGNAVPCLFGEAIGKHLTAFDRGCLAQGREVGKMSRYQGTDHDSWRESVAGIERQLQFPIEL
jgi:DNA (cytosine-5)-methyltransferase 1